MPFDPAYPSSHAPNSSALMRDQLNALKALIDAVPSVTNAVVNDTGTLSPGSNAVAGVTLNAGVLHFSFAIPRGNEGQPGAEGPQGPPFAQAVVDAVSTLSAGAPATVAVSFDGTNVHFTFGIPQGPPGEVTNADLTNAIAGTSNNTNALATLDTPMVDPDMESLRLKLNELILALRR